MVSRRVPRRASGVPDRTHEDRDYCTGMCASFTRFDQGSSGFRFKEGQASYEDSVGLGGISESTAKATMPTTLPRFHEQ